MAEDVAERRIALARHAMGLPNQRKVTYRNCYVTGAGSDNHAVWMAMVEAGLATRRDGARLPFGGDDLFTLTREGGTAALLKDERLRHEDFPFEFEKAPTT